MITTLLLALAAIVALLLLGLAAFTALVARRVEALVPPLGRFIEVDGCRLHYLDTGSGPAIVMIHGLGSQMRNFTYALVERLTPSFRVILFDRPGSGYSTRPSALDARLGTQAATLARAIRQLGIERPLVLGHSLGGAVALALALDHPDAVGGLALVAPLTHPQDDPPEALRGMAIGSSAWRFVVAWLFATPAALASGTTLIEKVFAPDPLPSDFGEKAGGLLSLRPVSFSNASKDMAAVNADLPGMVTRYAALRLPIGILFGASDTILDPRTNGEAFVAKVPGAEFERVEGGGHMTPLSAPDRTARFVARMAERVARERADTSRPTIS